MSFEKITVSGSACCINLPLKLKKKKKKKEYSLVHFFFAIHADTHTHTDICTNMHTYRITENLILLVIFVEYLFSIVLHTGYSLFTVDEMFDFDLKKSAFKAI